MNRVFKIQELLSIPDGTKVCPLLNPLDSNEKNLSPEILSGMSIAVGEIGARVHSQIHLHPIVSQVTWVLEGHLRVKMKGEADAQPYTLDLSPDQAVLTEPRTFFQLINPSSTERTRVLYLVSPAYVFEKEGDQIVCDDALVLNQTWEQLVNQNWALAELKDFSEIAHRREQAIKRIAARKRSQLATG